MPEIEVTEWNDGDEHYFLLHHPYDLFLLDLESLELSLPTRADAERAADLVATAITGSAD